MLRVEGIDHVALTVVDVQRSVAWYEDVLGLQRRYQDVWGDFPAVVGVGTTALALFPLPPAEPHTSSASRGPSVRHIAFRVDRQTFDTVRGHLEARAITWRFQDHAAAHSLYFADPDGHQLEITTYLTRT